MKKVLIIANLFHASPRIPSLAKYLTEFGWQPIILTTPIGESPDSRFGPPNDFKNNVRTIETGNFSTPYEQKGNMLTKINERFNITSKRSLSFLKLFYRFYSAIVNYPDSEKGWKPFAVNSGSEVLQNEGVDAMISSSSPVTCHIIAKELKIKYKIPWVADFRDLWTQNFIYGYGYLRKLIERRLELKTLSVADALVTVSQPCAEKLKELHKREEVYTITNGFDPERLDEEKIDLTSKFTITYTGYIYRRQQDPSKLFAALQDLISDETIDPNDIEVRFYGPELEWLPNEIEEYGLSAIAKYYGILPRQISFKKQRESWLLLLFNWEDEREKGCYPLKVFEYLAAKRPILATGGFGSDVIEKLLEEIKAGMYCKTVEGIKKVLSELYSEYKLKSEITYNENMEKINKYSYREMARKFAEVLDTITRR